MTKFTYLKDVEASTPMGIFSWARKLITDLNALTLTGAGATGADGAPGADGADGAPGPAGADGADGADGNFDGVLLGFAPLTAGIEPIQLVSDGSGQCIMVPFYA